MDDFEETESDVAFEQVLSALEEIPEYAECVRQFREFKEYADDIGNMRECKRLLEEGTLEENVRFARKMAFHYEEDFGTLAELEPDFAAPPPFPCPPIMWKCFGRELVKIILFFIPLLVAAREYRRDVLEDMIGSIRSGGYPRSW